MKPIQLAQILGLSVLLGACAHNHSTNSEHLGFADDIAASRHFLKPIFSILDCEREEAIEAGEVDEHFDSLFLYVDRDLNRAISQQELVRSAINSHPSKELYIFKKMDADQNLEVSIEEFRRFVIFAIETADINRDGELTLEEARFDTVVMAADHPLTHNH